MTTMVQTYELNKTKEVIPLLNQDLTELQTLTSRINNIYISIGEHINTMTKAKDEESKDLMNKKVVIIDTLTGIVEEYKCYKVEIDQVKKALQETSKQKDQLENQSIKLNDHIERLNMDLQSGQKSHDKEIASIQDRMEFMKEKAILDLQKAHQEEIQKLHEASNEKVKALLNELESSNKAIKKNK